MAERKFIANKYTRFLSKVDCKNFDPDTCWPWTGGGKGNGYGNVRINGTNIASHRLSYLLFVGEIPIGMEVCHTCDNRHCVNPDHLLVGTRKDNVADMVHKGRAAGGKRKWLKEDHVQEILRRLSSGHSRRKISVQMNINYSTVSAIARGDSYVAVNK